MSIKTLGLKKNTYGYPKAPWRRSLEDRVKQKATASIWLTINKKVASTLIAEKIFGIKSGRYNKFSTLVTKNDTNIDPALFDLIKMSRIYLPKTYYEVQAGLTRLIRCIRLDDFSWKRRKTVVNKSELSFAIDELVEFIYALRQRQEFYWWVGIYEPQASESSAVCTSLRGFFDGKLWMPIPDELGGTCCSKLLKKTEELKDEANPDFDPFILMKHCTKRKHIYQMLQSRTVEDLEAEHRYMLETTMQALAENV